MLAVILSIAVLGAFALTAGGLWLVFSRGERRQGWLMVLAAAVLFANVLIWSLPPR